MTRLLSDLELILRQPGDDVRRVYERAAPRYGHFREAWLKLAGAGAEQAMQHYLAEILAPGQRILDAGAGTGAISRQVLALEPGVQMTLLDLTPVMLAQAADVPGEKVEGSVLDLPFADETFDVVVSGWVIETVPDPRQAVAEYLRVITPAGYVLYTFCSLPDGWLSRAGSVLLRAAVGQGFAGRFLPDEDIPWHDCERSRRARFHGGLATFILLRKCCPVGAGVLPVAMDRVPPTPLGAADRGGSV